MSSSGMRLYFLKTVPNHIESLELKFDFFVGRAVKMGV